MARDLVDDLWTNLEHVSEWVRFADTKAAGVLTIDGIIATVLVTKYSGTDLAGRRAVVVFLGVAGFFLILSGLACMACLVPRLRIGSPNNLVYFSGIGAHRSHVDYLIALRAADAADALADELAREVWSRSRAAIKKYLFIRWALLLLLPALLASVVLGVVEVAG